MIDSLLIHFFLLQNVDRMYLMLFKLAKCAQMRKTVLKPCNKKRVEAAVTSIKRTCCIENFNFSQASVYTLNFVNVFF